MSLPLRRTAPLLATATALVLSLAACGGQNESENVGNSSGNVSGEVVVDGSSTVQPFAEAAVELFSAEAPNVRVSVGGAGTGDGFERFCRGETQISDASRAIEAEEIEACEKTGVEPVELQVAQDGLSIVANQQLEIPENCIDVKQLEQLLRPRSEVSNYSELGSGFPAQEASFFTPGTESGTYDYFTEEVLDTDAEQRTDKVQTSADDNQIVTGITGTEGALGYVGFSFADENKDKLKVLNVKGEDGQCVEPTLESVQANEYPLSRPLFMYPSRESLRKPEVKGFLTFVAANYDKIAEAANNVPMAEEIAKETAQIVRSGQGGEPETPAS